MCHWNNKNSNYAIQNYKFGKYKTNGYFKLVIYKSSNASDASDV